MTRQTEKLTNGMATPESVLRAPTVQMDATLPPESGIRIDFPGKLGVRSILGKVRPRAQRHLKQFSCGSKDGQAHNLIIEGDNLQVMASLYRYRGQVDLVIADPPYNTGNDFRYNDRWDEDPNDPDPGKIVAADDGARHSKWLRFMAVRLEMIKAMLKPGGVCAVCIDDRELFRLGMLMDEIFKERNRLAIINWQKTYSAKNNSGHVSTATEYILVYAKNKDKATTGLLERTEQMNARYSTPDNDPHPWNDDNLTAKAHAKPEDYGIQSPFTGEIHYPKGSGRWRKTKADIKRCLEAWGSPYVEMKDPSATKPSLVLHGTKLMGGQLVTPDLILEEARTRALEIRDTQVWPEIFFLQNGEGRPRLKRYLKDVKKGRVPMSYWADEDYEEPLVLGTQSWEHTESGHSQTGITELAAILGPKHGFETVKPLKLFSKLIQLWCPPDGLVLDPFAGSGTTGHAVLQLNYETDATRRFILIEQSRPDAKDPFARTITAERVRRVITGEWHTGPQTPLPGEFTFRMSTSQVDRKVIIAMQREELVDLILMSHWDFRNRKGPMLTTLTHTDYRYLVAKDIAKNGYFLVWQGPDERAPLTVQVLTEIITEARKEELVPPYHVYARTSHMVIDSVIFYQIPDEILRKIGFHDPFDGEDT